jgi:hypothetical protein
MLPQAVAPAQARVALTRVLRRTLEAPGTFDADGWLKIGLAGHQPGLGETYICTGSLYLCSAVLLPLGLPPDHPFWTAPPQRTTWEKAWSGDDLAADSSLRGKAVAAGKSKKSWVPGVLRRLMRRISRHRG